MTLKLSICIPTLDRLDCLNNCLNSILIAHNTYTIPFEVCVSDNNQNGNAEKIVKKYQEFYSIKYFCNKSNTGVGNNIINSVSLAEGEFVWIIGNDDFLLPNAFFDLENILNKESIDYLYINSKKLSSKFYNLSDGPIDTKSIPSNLENFSSIKESFESNFLDLVDPKISFDFLLGMFLSVFRRDKWLEGLDSIDKIKLSDNYTFSYLENTCPHVKIFANSFNNSRAWFNSKPLSVNMSGEREWNHLYPLVDSIRIPEIIDEFYKNGLPFGQYLKCKNFALKRLLPNLFLMIFSKKYSGLRYISVKKNILPNLLFPSIYIYPIIYIIKKIISKLR
tara:strand:- start:707 stop:1711 length:1005 start_codon:yes stop_codon:yes gene_type:complete